MFQAETFFEKHWDGAREIVIAQVSEHYKKPQNNQYSDSILIEHYQERKFWKIRYKKYSQVLQL